MAEQLGGLGGALQGTAQGALMKGQNILDTILPPEKRAELWARFNRFATERPKLAAFLISHIAISGLPLGLFILMTLTVAIFSIVAALLVALLGALLFIVFAVGVALCFLLPTLFFTTMVATFLFLWGIGAYYLLKWFNEKRIPGIHTGFVEGIKGEFLGSGEVSENGKLSALNPPAGGTLKDKQEMGIRDNSMHKDTGKQNGHPRNDKEPHSDNSAYSDRIAKSTATDTVASTPDALGAKQRDIPKLATKPVDSLKAS